jgi:D-alanine transaminase
MEIIKAVFNGKFDSLENIQVSPLSRAYTFSDSVYEVVPFHNSVPIAYKSHINRLKYSANALSIKIDLDEISNEINKLISLCTSTSGYVYYQVTRGQDLIRTHIYSNDLELETFGYVTSHTFKTKFLKVMVCKDLRWGRCDIKSTSLLGNILTMNEAKEQGCDEVIMHNENILTEAGASNLFFVKDGDICTPALSNNILPGITRQILIDTMSDLDIKVYEADFTIDDLKNATAAWLTSSTKGIAPIEEIINLDCNLTQTDDKYLIAKQAFDSKFFSKRSF